MTTFRFETREERDRKAADKLCADVWDRMAREWTKGSVSRPIASWPQAIEAETRNTRRHKRRILDAIEDINDCCRSITCNQKVVRLDAWRLVNLPSDKGKPDV